MGNKAPRLAEYTKNAARAVIASDVGLSALHFALGRIDRMRGSTEERRRIADATDVVYSALYQEHRRRVHVLLRMLLASDEIEQAKVLAFEDFRGGHVAHLGVPELQEAGIVDGKAADELLETLRAALLREGVR